MADFTFTDHGTVVLLTPHTAEAVDFVTENVYYESWQVCGESLAVEARLAVDIYRTVIEYGFTVDGNMGVTDAF